MKKKNFIIFIVNLIIIMSSFGKGTVLADEMVGFRGKDMCKSGNFVYYIRTMGY